MVVKKRRVLLAFAIAAAAALVIAQLAGAIHPRPQGATPLRISLVPAYEECTAPNTTHGPPLSFPSCTPPVQTSDYLTVGTPDANGAPAKSVGWLSWTVRTSPQEDLVVKAEITDVRCKPATAAGVCGSANATGPPDYAGDLQADATIRMTDHYNGPNHDQAATVIDIPNPVGMFCGSTADTTIGGTCTVQTTALQPGTPVPNQDWFVGKRVVVEFTETKVFDGGQDGINSTSGNTLFMTQGVFLP